MNDKHLRFGVYLPPFGPFGDPRALVEVARRAEAAGWDGLFLWDHVLGDGDVPVTDPWVSLGAIANTTSRLSIGTTMTPLARRRPWIVARHAAALSELSGGRFVLGVGLGSDEYGDFTAFGEVDTPKARADLLDDGLDVLAAMWSGQPLRADGRYRVDIPAGRPIQHHIPVWVANTPPGNASLTRAARFDGVFPNNPDRNVSPDDVSRIRATVRERGLPTERPFDVAVAGNASPAWPDDHDVDLVALADAGVTWWMESFIHFDPLELSLDVVDAGPPPVG
jgi:alkanesulfonate monooxygenase SsuD/methylene tetrahydromethanopterin reductase-like flavin-dependent oxidoreductase (luciferase family)